MVVLLLVHLDQRITAGPRAGHGARVDTPDRRPGTMTTVWGLRTPHGGPSLRGHEHRRLSQIRDEGMRRETTSF
jgi:hypothetical protein